MTWLIQLASLLIAISWFIPVELYRRYITLHALPDPSRYRAAYASDWLTALVFLSLLMSILTLLEWPELFPSRRDYLVLMPLPLTRAQLFLAKLASLFLFVTLFIAAITVLSSIAFPAISAGTWEKHPLPMRMLAFFISSAGLAYFLFLSLFFVQGCLLNLLPMRWFSACSFTIQVILLVAVICAFPVFPYLPVGHLLATNSPWLEWLPPAWFWGLGEWTLGGTTWHLANRALIASAIATAGSLLTYLISYARYSRFSSELVRRDHARIVDWPARFASVFPSPTGRATAEFLLRTLARGRQQKLVLLLVAGIGVALALESGVYLMIHPPRWQPKRTIEEAIIAVPLTLSFFLMVGLRRAFRTASELPANWLFAFVEDPVSRRQQLDSVFLTFAAIGALPVLAVCSPILFLFFGAASIPVMAVQALLMFTYAEYLMQDWRAIPFTFTQNAARRHVIQSAVIHILEFCVYSVISSSWIQSGIRSAKIMLWFAAVVLVVLVWMHRRRKREWGLVPLEFAEADPRDLQTLGLSGLGGIARS